MTRSFPIARLLEVPMNAVFAWKRTPNRTRWIGVLLLPLMTGCLGTDIAGTWKHSEKPAWIDIVFEAGRGTATILRHGENPEAEGLELLREIESLQGDRRRWRAAIYDGSSDRFVPVTLELDSSGDLIVSRSQGGRVDEVLRLRRPPSSSPFASRRPESGDPADLVQPTRAVRAPSTGNTTPLIWAASSEATRVDLQNVRR